MRLRAGDGSRSTRGATAGKTAEGYALYTYAAIQAWAAAANTAGSVEFDATVNSHLPWSFRPNDTRMRVRVGEQYEITYYAHNDSVAAVVGSATPSVATSTT